MSEESRAQKFTYAAHKGGYLSVLGAFLFLTLAESTLIVFLVLRFVPAAPVQAALLTLIGLLLVALFGKLLVPLWTSHRLSSTALDLHYGLDFHARVPLALLLSAQPVKERVGAFAVPHYDAEKQRISLAFSEHGQVLLHLARPRAFRLRLRSDCLADELLISLDQRDAFLAALKKLHLAHPEQSTTDAPDARAAIAAEPPGLLQVGRYAPGAIAEDAPVTLRAEQLTRRFAGLTVVEDLNLAIRAGEIYGFLGPNGAGKSTTIKMLVGLLRPDAGRAWLAGHDVWQDPIQAKSALGYVADRALLYPRLSGREFLDFLAQLRGLPLTEARTRIDTLLDLLELTEAADRPCGSYSFGMKRKLALAGALLPRPAVLILDEPLNGLDPRSARRLKDLFAQLAADGATIFLSTHDLATAGEICQRIGILDRGHLLAEGTPAELRTLASAPNLEEVFMTLTARTQEVSA
jgi:ABC-2 type transport system ATP-binding protein